MSGMYGKWKQARKCFSDWRLGDLLFHFRIITIFQYYILIDRELNKLSNHKKTMESDKIKDLLNLSQLPETRDSSKALYQFVWYVLDRASRLTYHKRRF